MVLNHLSLTLVLLLCVFQDLATRVPLFKSPNEDGHYILPASPLKSPIQSYSTALGSWYARLGHASPSTVHRLVTNNSLSSDSSSSSRSSLCQACVKRKIHKFPFSISEYSARPLD